MVPAMPDRPSSRLRLRLACACSGLVALTLAACTQAPPTAAAPPPPAAAAPAHEHRPPGSAEAGGADQNKQLDEVAAIHGGAGPWAVLGYRMGQSALQTLHLPKGSFALDVRHESPRTPQYACVADGAQAATGASLGKVNLSLVEADEAHIQTTYRNKQTGESVTLRPTASFRARFLNVPRAKLREAGAEVLTLPDAALFEVATPETKAKAGPSGAPIPDGSGQKESKGEP
jgi:formylmethanofuran dehydrogenase subunit E